MANRVAPQPGSATADRGPVALVHGARAGVDDALTGGARRRADKLATASVPVKKLRALRKSLEKVATDAAELGLVLSVDRAALAALAEPSAAPLAPAPASASASAEPTAAPTPPAPARTPRATRAARTTRRTPAR